MNFSPNRIRINYGSSEIELTDIKCPNKVDCQKLQLTFDINDDGVITPTIFALEDINPEWLNIEFDISEDALGKDLYYYYAAFTTNDITSVFKHTEKPKNDMKDLFVAKNTVKNINMNIGLITGQRIFALMRLDGNVISVHYDLEGRLIEKGNTLALEKFIYGSENEFDFLDKRYAPLAAKYNNARPLANVPAGWCSWSRYYRNVDENKILNCVEDMTQIKGANLFQIDDGWQIDGTFPGDWEIDRKKFPNGLDEIIEKCNDNGMTFGLWLSPFLVAENSVYYESIKHLARQDVIAGNSTPSNTYRIFDLDNPEFYEKLYKTYHWLSHEMGVKYYKLDFLVFGYFSFRCAIRFKSDYRSALFRKVISTIREAVGDDVILLSCGSPIIECAGIFDAQRESRDIICPKSSNDPFYWQHWSNIKNASKTVLYRYFYNNRVFRNDPDGAVLRDFDIGDGFDCSYAEARYWSTIVAFSGGLVLSNDEFRNLSQARKNLFTKLLPALGISGRAVDMFEYPAPTKAIIEAPNNVKYITLFNMSDKFENIDVNLTDFGILGEKLVFKCWEAEFVGKTDIVHEKLVNPHNALMYMVKDVPTKPEFIYSDVNVYLGENIFKSDFANGKLTIKIDNAYKDFVTDETKVFAYYPIEFEGNILDSEEIVSKTEEYIITKYNI